MIERMWEEQGQVVVLVLGLALVAIAVSGLAVDGTRAFLARRALQQTADAASLAAASEIDAGTYYDSGGARVRLDPARARAMARRWAERSHLDTEAVVVADGGGVRVVLRARVPTTFLSLAGISELPVAVEAAAAPVAD
jgi:uncharacterized membrane protein